MLNSNKRNSLLQLFNCISIQKGVQTLKEFANGIIFYQMIISLFPEKGNEVSQDVKQVESCNNFKCTSDALANVKKSDSTVDEKHAYKNDITEAINGSMDKSYVSEQTAAVNDTISENSPLFVCTSSDKLNSESGDMELSNNEIVQNGPTNSATLADGDEFVQNGPTNYSSLTRNSESVQNVPTDNAVLSEDVCNGDNLSLHAVNISGAENTSMCCEVSPNSVNGPDFAKSSEENSEFIFQKPYDANHVSDISFKVEDNFENENDDLKSISHEDNSRTVSPGNVVNDAVKEDKNSIPAIEERYDTIKTFIEGMLELNSEELVNYKDCMKGNEFEIAKLTVLFLCAWLQNYLLTDFTFGETICHLEQDVQEEIRECLELFLIKRSSPIKKNEFHDVLKRTVRPRSSPRWRTPDTITPQSRKTKTTRTRSKKDVQFIQDNTIESPMKSFLQSPDLRQITPKTKQAIIEDAVSRKNKEISKLFVSLAEETYKNDELLEQIQKLELEISQLKNEMEKMKAKYVQERQTTEEDMVTLLKKNENLEEEITKLKQQNKQLEDALKEAEAENKLSEYEDEISDGRITAFQFIRKEEKIKEYESRIELYKEMEQEFEALKTFCLENFGDNDELQELLSEFGSGRCQFHDFSIREALDKELKMKEAELVSYKEFMEAKCIELQDTVKKLTKSENDWKAKFRKADKERENAMKSSSKKIRSLELELVKVKTQYEIYANHQCISSIQMTAINNSGPSNSELLNDNDSKSLWHSSSFNVSESNIEVIKSEIGHEKGNEQSSNLVETKPLHKRKSLNDTFLEKPNESVDKCSAVKSTNGRLLQCSLDEYEKIKSCVLEILKDFKERDVKDDMLPFYVDEFEKSFVSVKELTSVLVLIHKLFQNLLKNTCSDENIHKIGDTKIQKTTNSTCDIKHSSVEEKIVDVPQKKVEEELRKTIESLNDKYLLLELEMKQMKNEFELKERNLLEKLSKAEDDKIKYAKKIIKIQQDHEKLRTKINTLVQTLNVYEKEKSSLMKSLYLLKCTINKQKLEIEHLRRENQEVRANNVDLEKKVEILKSFKMGDFKTPLYTAAEVLMKSAKKKNIQGRGVEESEDDIFEEDPESAKEIVDTVFEDERINRSSSLRSSRLDNSKHYNFCHQEDEECMVNESSISSLNPNNRLKDLQHRNSMYLPHLKSTYPLELENTPTSSKYLEPPSPMPSKISKNDWIRRKKFNDKERLKLIFKEQSSQKKHPNSVKSKLNSGTLRGWSSSCNNDGQSDKMQTLHEKLASSNNDFSQSAKRRKISKAFAISSDSVRNSLCYVTTPKQVSSTQKVLKPPQSLLRLMNHKRKQR